MLNNFSKPIKEDKNRANRATQHFMSSSSFSSNSNTTTIVTTPPTPSPVNQEQVNNFFLFIEQCLWAQTNNLPLSYPYPLPTNHCWSNLSHTTICTIWLSPGPAADHSHWKFSGYYQFWPFQGELGSLSTSPTYSQSMIPSTPKQSQESQRVSTPYNPSTPPIHCCMKSTTLTKPKQFEL